MKKILNLVLKNVGLLAVSVLFLSANTTSGWVAHQPEIPDDIKKFKI
ncbi:cyclic lactone autoinducer peptide [Clostridioides difficile]